MKKSVKILGLSILFVNMIGLGVDTVSAEPVAESNVKTETVEGSEALEAIEETSEPDGQQEELKIWDVVFDPMTDKITGKTAPYAEVFAVNTSMGDVLAGSTKADENGHFVFDHPTSGLHQLEARLNGKVSAPYELDTENPRIKYTLQFHYFYYWDDTHTIVAGTAPYATVYVESASFEKISLSANEHGQFTLDKDFPLGEPLTFTAEDAFGNMGEPQTYVVPTKEFLEELRVKEIFYDYSTSTLTAKTMPNATVILTVVNGIERMCKADSIGNLTIHVDLSSGAAVRLAPNIDYVVGPTSEYSVPDNPLAKGNTDAKSNGVTEPSSYLELNKKSADKNNLPKTGSENGMGLSLIGSLTLLSAGAWFYKRFLKN